MLALYVFLGLPCAVIGVVSWFAGGWGRRYPAVAPMLLGVVWLMIATATSSSPDGPGATLFALEVAGAVGLGWWGYARQRRRGGAASVEMLLATLAAPTPSLRTIRSEDVIGRWQFYVDAATSTVTVDLQADSRYAQTIMGNGGETVDCPGGTWILNGSHLELTSYRSAARAVTECVRWFFGDWQNDLVLFAKDDPQAETMLLGWRTPARAVF